MKDLTPLLHGIAPDPVAMTDARAFALMLPEAGRLSGRLEDLLMCFAYFVKDHAGPRLPGGHTEALHVLSFAASGLYAFLEDGQRHGEDGWATLARARLWAVDKCQTASADLSGDEVERLHTAFSNPHLLPVWAFEVRQAGREVEGGRLAAWWAVSHLLNTAPTLEDGEAEDLTAELLTALAAPTPAPPVRPLPDDLPFPVYEAQHVEDLPGSRVRVCMGGSEDYEVGREDVAFTPLPAGGAFLSVFVGTPDAVTVRLSPSDARQVCQVFGLPYEDGDGQASPLN